MTPSRPGIIQDHAKMWSPGRRRRSLSISWSTFLPLLFILFLKHLSASPPEMESLSSSSSMSEQELDFSRNYYNASIPENAIGKTFVVPTTKMGMYLPPNYGDLSVRFRIVSGDRDELFKADSRQVGDFCFLLLRTRTGNKKVLNREYLDFYHLKIKATVTSVDGSRQPPIKAKAKTEVFVRVLDTNDLNPLFYPVEYNTTLPEDAPLNRPFLTVSASDADLGPNGEVYYRLLQPTLQFAIHPTRGTLTLTRPLDHREQQLHVLTVAVEDRGPKLGAYDPKRASTATVKVHVSPVNLHSPEISVRSFQTPLSSNSEGGDVCAIIRVTDRDRGPHGEIAGVSIVSGDSDGLFRIVEGQVPNEFNVELDRRPPGSSTNQEYSLTLKAMDKGTPRRDSAQIVRVRISDASEKPLSFERDKYEAFITEMVPVNTPVLRFAVVQSQDQPLPSNTNNNNNNNHGDVLYYLEDGNAGGAFHLNPRTGQLSTAKPLDHEMRPHYTLTVSAAHKGLRGLHRKITARVEVTVVDANDNDPVFNISHLPEGSVSNGGSTIVVVHFSENQEAGSVVYTAKAEDRDAGENGYISYSLANLNMVPFTVDHFTGEVKTTEKLDFETSRRDYILKVRASDWGAPYRRQAELTLRVKVTDFNDNRPQFEKAACTIQVARRAPLNTELITLSAIDFDANSIVSYRMIPHNDDNCFKLDQNSGTLRLSCDLSKTNSREKSLNFSATDGTYFSDVVSVDIKVTGGARVPGSGDKLTSADCRDVGVTERYREQLRMGELNNRVGVDDVTEPTPTRFTENRHAPEFSSTLPTEVAIREDAAIGSKVALASARDPDHGYNGRVVHVVSNGDDDGCFRLDLESGLLLIERTLDRESVSRYVLNISAYDLGAPQKSVSRTLAVRVLDVNDNAPKFEKSAYSFVIPENAKNGTSVVRLRATDVDEGINAELTFKLLTDTDEFTVDSRSGLVSVSGPLDRERAELYRLRVRVIDGDPEHPLSSTTLVSVRLTDINDNPPEFGQHTHVAKVREDLPPGAVIVTMAAHDPDLGDGGAVRYDIIEGADDCFSVDEMTGVVRLTKKLDFETKQLYNVTLRARDRDQPPLSSLASLLVEVEDVNENIHPPKFSDFVVTGAVRENQKLGTFVMRVTATDQDSPGPDSRVVYSIRDGNGLGHFDIDDQGNIRTRVVLDAETESRYWLTVFAQDRGSVPFSTTLEVFIGVLNENDNVPLTLDPVYHAEVPESSPASTFVLRVDAFDLDSLPDLQPPPGGPRPTFKLTSGDFRGLFALDSETGILTTVSQTLDRETQSQYIMEVTVSDNGDPPLESTTRITIDISDINDNAPEFLMKVTHHCIVPEMNAQTQDIALCQVVAWDRDIGPNGRITYSIVEGSSNNDRFSINPTTGIITSQKSLEAGQNYVFTVLASDGGSPSLNARASVFLEVVTVPKSSPNPPLLVSAKDAVVHVTERDQVGHLVTLVTAHDADNDRLWYFIIDGNQGNAFSIKMDEGAVLLAKLLDWETQPVYNLTIKVTDGVHSVYSSLQVQVLDENEHSPMFLQNAFSVDIPENIPLGQPFFQLTAQDKDQDKKIFYGLVNSASPRSLEHFNVDANDGSVSVVKALDFESCRKHILTVEVKDQGTPAKRDFARIHVYVQDRNDHPPEFLSPMFEGKVFETSSLGTSVVQLVAIDRDKGFNAQISYAIVSGNVAAAFSIEPTLGTLQVAHELDSQIMPEYFLVVRATDHGFPPLNSTVTVRITVTQADNAPPKFEQDHFSVELYENERSGTSIAALQVRSQSSVYFELVSGNEDKSFVIDTISGVVRTGKILDFETKRFYNLTARATNMMNTNATATLSVHVLDRNDNAPIFENSTYQGWVSEAAEVGSFAFTKDMNPLVVTASDKDSERNAILQFEIVEKFAQKYFQVDARTGALSIVSPLDHESHPYLSFSVHLSDLGQPRLSSTTSALVNITVIDVNDCAPVFQKPLYLATLLLPTYRGVVITRVEATDPDSTVLKYSIVSGNHGSKFEIDSTSGDILVVSPDNLKMDYELIISADDGQFESSVSVRISIRETHSSGLKFGKEKYQVELLENVSGQAENVCIVTVLGSSLDEHLSFAIRNPSPMFTIGPTSGAVRTTGLMFDREARSAYTLVVEAKSDLPDAPRVAHVLIEVTITDVNDNSPMFVNLPYHCVVPVEAQPGDLVRKVQAIDLDMGPNGFVHYELIESDFDIFSIDEKTGDIRLKQNLGTHNTDYSLKVVASDSGKPPLKSQVIVPVKVINRNMPVFPQQFYTVSVPENLPSQVPVLTVQASSPQGRQLIYSIVEGNSLEEFAVDFNTDPGPSTGPCVIYVVEELDYEIAQSHQLTLRATDSVSGAYAEVQVSINVEDINDNPPMFVQTSFNASVSESSPMGTSVLKLSATDRDTGANKKIQYQIADLLSAPEFSMDPAKSVSSSFFHLDPMEGILFIKQSLDHETCPMHHLTVVAADGGSPTLSSTAHVWITISDTNDNPPKFDHSTYTCKISEHASRDQFVTLVAASDPDAQDQNKLAYSIVAGNELQIFSIDKDTGKLTLSSVQHLTNMSRHSLNVSVTDGAHSAHAQIIVDVQPANYHSPVFSKTSYEVALSENSPSGSVLTTLTAEDKDKGIYGRFKFALQSQEGKRLFNLDPHSGKIISQEPIDREKRHIYEIPVSATDGGGRVGFSMVRVTLTDLNDNTPQFSVAEYKTSINANTTIGTTILKIHASDADEGAAGSIEYSIYENRQGGGIGQGQDVFGITHDSGEIYIQQNLSNLQNTVHRFFVRAQDKGSPRQESHVPVVVTVTDVGESPPAFEQLSFEFFLSEGSPMGTIITTLNVTRTGVKFRLAPTLEGSEAETQLSRFSLDEISGRLMLMAELDRETLDTYSVTVLAEFDQNYNSQEMDGGSLIGSTDILIRVMDENDNPPRFDSESYYSLIAENSPKGSTVLRVSATDNDIGKSKDLIYAFGDGAEIAAGVFQLDPKTGWLTTIMALDRETTPNYRFQVVATDGGTRPLTSSVTVVVEVKDYNDNPPVFKRPRYSVSVNEDHMPGHVMLTLETSDADLPDRDSPNQFYITSGNPQERFGINHNGEVYVNQPLDRETKANYVLEVTVTDGKFESKTQLFVEVMDVNDNAPVCLKSKYTELVSESIAPQTFILTVEASDADEGGNALLEFSLAGEGADDLYMDSSSGLGLLKTAKPLDRERQSRYTLTAHVRDIGKPEWHCTSLVEIILVDINDNSPVFSQDLHSVTVPEDSQVGTLVSKVHATDPDLGMNRRISYSFVDSAHGHFSVDSSTGIIRLHKPLDRETRDTYNLTVQARDHGTPQLSSLTTLLVMVQDINDNPPEFAQSFYFATVFESSPPGLEVVRIIATSKDSGVNAEISYSLIEGNDHGSFAVHHKSGVISVAKILDYEAIRDYCLTVLAQDGGTPPLSNRVTLNISVNDANDNPPIFSQTHYFALVSEDVRVGHTAIQLLASDADSAPNGRLTFTLLHGGNNGQFSVHPETGDVVISAPLDRETISNYVLHVECTDSGSPHLSTTAVINIEVADVNDNPPLFSQINYTAIVQEGKPIGFTILKFLVTDIDAPPNDGPFKFDIQSGNEDKSFRLVQQDGTLRSASQYDHLLRNDYSLHIRVTDKGSPPLSSETFVSIRVIEESRYAPLIRPMRISVSSYLDDFPGGALGRIHASDDDPYDKLTFAIVSSHNHLFSVGREDGLLKAIASLDVGSYDVNISVTDDKFTSHSMISVDVSMVSQEAVDNGVVLTLASVTPEDFLLTYRSGFLKGLQDIFVVRQRSIEVLSIQPAKRSNVGTEKPFKTDKTRRKQEGGGGGGKRHRRDSNSQDDGDLDVLFSIQRPGTTVMGTGSTGGTGPGATGGTYFTPAEIRTRLREKWSSFQATVRLKMIQISKNRCNEDYCEKGQCQDRMMLEQESPLSIATEEFSFVFPQHNQNMNCICHLGYGGIRCEVIVNECARHPCPDPQICVPGSDRSSPLLAHMGTSNMGGNGGGMGAGNQHPTSTGYTCQCPSGKVGVNCDQDEPCIGNNCYISRSPVSFAGRSYAHYSLNTPMERHLTLSLHVRTKQATGNLMFASGYRDYSILEVVDGFVRYRFDCGSGEGVVTVDHLRINDGYWHLVNIERHSNTARVVVDEQFKAAGGAPGVNDIINLDGMDVYFGAEVRWPRSLNPNNHFGPGGGGGGSSGGSSMTNQGGMISKITEDIRMGFMGCMDDIRIDGTPVPLHVPSSNQVATLKRFKNVEFHCRSLIEPGPCGNQPCANGASCTLTTTGVQGFICQCPPRFVGPFCKTDTDPCASDPCLNGGKCHNLNNDYSCDCPGRLSGKRCDYGRYCTPNPCMNGSPCEEGSSGPICKCRGYHGDRCQNDLDECQLNPCARGATCINLIGSFQCHCPPNVTGLTCSDYLYTTSITSSSWNTTLEEVIGITIVIIFIFFLAVLLACCWRYRHKRRRHRPNNEIRDDPVAGEFLMKNPVLEKDNLKRQSKLSNLEVTTTFGSGGCNQGVPHLPPRPLSYTPSNHPNTHPHRLKSDEISAFSKFDTLHSYGSAGADLESLPCYSTEFLQNLSKPLSSTSGANAACNSNANPSLNKMSDSCGWDLQDDHAKDKIYEEKIQNDLKSSRPTTGGGGGSDSVLTPRSQGVNSAMSMNSMEDGPGYHWDCSDWAQQKPLANITEVSMNELRDSSSLHSGESNNNCQRDHHHQHRNNSNHNNNNNNSSSQTDPLLGSPPPIRRPCLLPGLISSRNRIKQDFDQSEDSDAAIQNELYDDVSSSMGIGGGLSPGMDHSPSSIDPIFESFLDLKELDYADDGVESLPSSPTKYAFHPNHYLPLHSGGGGAASQHQDQNSSVSGWDSNLRPNICELSEDDDLDDDIPNSCYLGGGTSPAKNQTINNCTTTQGGAHRGSISIDQSTSSDQNGDGTKTSGLDSMSVSLGGGYTSTNASCSDISANVCEIEDSEANFSEDSDEGVMLHRRNSRSKQEIPLLSQSTAVV